MLNKDQIKYNKDKFLELISSINVEDADIEGLKQFLEDSDFFYAPATIRYSGAYEGGLCEYCLKTYYNLARLAKGFVYETSTELKPDMDENGNPIIDKQTNKPVMKKYIEHHQVYSDNTIKIVGLLHALSKVNFYKATEKNKKVYNDYGRFTDERGNKYDWDKEFVYSVRDAAERDTYGSKALNSFFAISKFIPLSQEETIAILNQAVGMDKSEESDDTYNVLAKSPLTILLHNAIMITLYINPIFPRMRTSDEQGN